MRKCLFIILLCSFLCNQSQAKPLACFKTTPTLLSEGKGYRLSIENGLQGLVDESGQTILPHLFDEIAKWDIEKQASAIRIRQGKLWGFIFLENQALITPNYDHAEPFTNYKDGAGNNITLALVTKDGQKGYINPSGKEQIKICYDYIEAFQHGLARVEKNRKWGYIDLDGNEIVPVKYAFARKHGNHLFSVKLHGKQGCIDMKGNVIVPFKYDYIMHFQNGYARVATAFYNGGKRTLKFGFINGKGEEVIPQRYHKALDFENELWRAKVKIDNIWLEVDPDGKEYGLTNWDDSLAHIQLDYKEYYNEEIGLSRVQHNKKWGYVDKNGHDIIPAIYDYIQHNEGNVFIARRNGKQGVLDSIGQVIVPFKYDYISDYSEGLSRVANVFYINGVRSLRYGFINKSGEEVIPIVYEKTYDFDKDGLAKAKRNGHWGHVDRSGNYYY